MTEDSYLNAYVPVSARLANVLDLTTRSGSAKMFLAGDQLAEQLGIDTGPLRVDAYHVLGNMLRELELALKEGPGHWTNDIEQDRARRMAESATLDLDLFDLVEAVRQFGLVRFRPALRIEHLDAIQAELREVIIDWLAPRVFRLLDQWRKRDAWNDDLRLGIVPRPSGKQKPA